MRRKPKVLAPSESAERKKRDHRDEVHDGKNARGMDPPNHMMPEDEFAYPEEIGVSRRYRWPLSMAMCRGESNNKALFVHPRYGATHWSEWADQPPTWMDPHLLVDMAMQDEEFKSLIQRATKNNNVTIYKQAEARLNVVFEEQYLPFVIEQFERYASSTVAQWAVNRGVQRKLDTPNKTRRRKRSKA